MNVGDPGNTNSLAARPSGWRRKIRWAAAAIFTGLLALMIFAIATGPSHGPNEETESPYDRNPYFRLAKDCESGVAWACLRKGIIEQRGGDGYVIGATPADAAHTLERACDLGSAEACGALAEMLAKGAGVRADPFRADQLLERACAGGYGPACAARDGARPPP